MRRRTRRLAEEASLAVAALSRDLGGYSGGNDGRLGTQAQLKFVGRMQPGGSQLWLCFDGGANPNGMADWGAPDTVIVYQVLGNYAHPHRPDFGAQLYRGPERCQSGRFRPGQPDSNCTDVSISKHDPHLHAHCERPMRRKNPRRGYAMLLVFVFLVLFLLFLGLAYTRLSSALRIETARAQQAQRDQGPIPAVGLGLALLQTGLPPSDPYVCAVTITGAGGIELLYRDLSIGRSQ